MFLYTCTLAYCARTVKTDFVILSHIGAHNALTNELICPGLPAAVVPASSTQTRLRCHCDAEKDKCLPKKCDAASEIFIRVQRSAGRLFQRSKARTHTHTLRHRRQAGKTSFTFRTKVQAPALVTI